MQKDTQTDAGLASHLTQELGMVKALVWHEWNTGTRTPIDLPIDELLLVEVDKRGEYFSAKFFLCGNGQTLGVVDGQFYFEKNILRWASIQHLVDA